MNQTTMVSVCPNFSLRWLAIMLLFFCFAGVLPAAAQESTRPGEPGLRVGQPAPAFRLKSADGTEVALTNLLMRGNVALVFYRSADW
jgi:hypothetical protein